MKNKELSEKLGIQVPDYAVITVSNFSRGSVYYELIIRTIVYGEY